MIRLFHSYQFLNLKHNIVYNKELKHFYDSNGNFILGLLNIPAIPNTQVHCETYSVSKRQTKKVSYRNHNQYNTKVYIDFSYNDLDVFMTKKKASDIHHLNLIKLIKSNFYQHNLDKNVFDLFCIKSTFQKGIDVQQTKLSLLTKTNLGKWDFDPSTNSINSSINSNSLNLNNEIVVNGSIIYADLSVKSRQLIINVLLKPLLANSLVYFVLEEGINYDLWKEHFDSLKLNCHEIKNIYGVKLIKVYKNGQYAMNRKCLICNFNNSLSDKVRKVFKYLDSKFSFDQKWLISNYVDDFTISNLVYLLYNFLLKEKSKDLNLEQFSINIFKNINNIYQLLKCVVSICKQEKLLELGINNDVNKCNLNDSLYLLFKISKNIKSSNKLLINQSCSICLESSKPLLKLKCDHTYCLECYKKHCHMIDKLSKNPFTNNEYHCCVCRTNFFNKEVTLHGFNEKHLIESINSRQDLKKIAKTKDIHSTFFSKHSIDYNLFKFLVTFLNKDKSLNTRYLSTSKKTNENTNANEISVSFTIDQFIHQNIKNKSKLIILGRNHFNEYKRLRQFGFTNVLVLT